MNFRSETRNQRYRNKINNAVTLPLSIVTVNFDFDDNLAFIIRTAACYGVKNIFVIGSVPPRKELHPRSGSLTDYVNIVSFENPGTFLRFSRENEIFLISAEIAENAKSLHDYSFNTELHTAIVLGNETTGIPVEIALNSEIVFIPMTGVGFCLNTSQTGTAFIHEYSRQFWSCKK
jgi:tRNA G18 (ribose-2'-O)-methylase SpoU